MAAMLLGVSATFYPVPATEAALDPGTIALTVNDLPRGFTVDPRGTRDGYVDGVGPATQVQYQREGTTDNLRSGPVVVGQIVIRVERSRDAGEALRLMRQRLIDQSGFSPSGDGPNDGATFTIQKSDHGGQLISVGFVRDGMMIVTTVGGQRGRVNVDDALNLANISAARLVAAGHS
jgi:hypothetical protein